MKMAGKKKLACESIKQVPSHAREKHERFAMIEPRVYELGTI